MIETWKKIENGYEVSVSGRVRSTKFERITELKLMLGKGRASYLFFHSSFKSVSKRINVHQAVARAFISNPNNYKEINHIDGNKLNNRIENLEWCSRSHNVKESFRLKLRTHEGEKNPKRKLTQREVREIRSFKGKKIYTYQQLADKYGVKEPTINTILSGLSWRNI